MILAAVVKLQLFCVVTLSSSTLLNAVGSGVLQWWIAWLEVAATLVNSTAELVVAAVAVAGAVSDVVALDAAAEVSLFSDLLILKSRHSNVSLPQSIVRCSSFSFSLSEMDGSR
jgi:hypothetical protein